MGSQPETLAQQSRARLGMNLAGPADWNTELPFVDVFRLSRPWISQQKGKRWGEGPPLELDELGWVKRLQPECWAETLMCTIDGGHYPSGKYTVFYRGRGKIDFWGAAKVVDQEPGRIVLDVDSTRGALFLRLLETDPQDYVRDIHVVMPGFEQTFREQPFHPKFLQRWQGMACFRFMDWMETNGSKIRSWSERPTPQHATFSERGVPLEWMIDLCNRQKADAWFCMPHAADDDYVRQFARMVRDRLDSTLKVYVEYSNEVWNGIFPQHHWAAEQGQKLGFADKPWEAAWRYTAYRSVQIFRIWEEEFKGTARLVRVLASQAAVPYVSEQIVTFQEAYQHADALAIAPYISLNVPATAESGKLSAEQLAKWSVEQVLDHVEKDSLPTAIEWMKAQAAVAKRYRLQLIAYEAGQHLVGVGGGENNEQLTQLLMAANRHPRMGEIYARYFKAWEEVGGDLLCHFSSVARWSKWGSWGLLEYFDEDERSSPKFMATLRWGRSRGQPVFVPE
jgi:hypothetical protein